MAYTSQNFQDRDYYINYYVEEYKPTITKAGKIRPTLTAEKIGSGMSYLNARLQNMVKNSKSGSIKNYQIYYDRFKDVVKFNNRIIKKYGEDASILKIRGRDTDGDPVYTDFKTGLIEFKTSGYGKFTSEERQEIMGRRDWLLNYWGMSESNKKLFESETNLLSQQTFKSNHSSYSNDVVEMFLKIFESPMWAKTRKTVKYDIDDMKDKIIDMQNKPDLDIDSILVTLAQSNDINEFFKNVGI